MAINLIQPTLGTLQRQDPSEQLYSFWEYKFQRHDQPESIRLAQSKKYKIKVARALSINMYQNIQSDKKKTNIPQADDINKIIQFPLRVMEGYDTSLKMVDVFVFDVRQSSYYRQAAEILETS